jgi:hypothetical protein
MRSDNKYGTNKTVRRIVSGPSSSHDIHESSKNKREVLSPFEIANLLTVDTSRLKLVVYNKKYTCDNNHTPATKTWGCKLFEHKSGRQWLQKNEKRQHHIDRKNRKEELLKD